SSSTPGSSSCSRSSSRSRDASMGQSLPTACPPPVHSQSCTYFCHLTQDLWPLLNSSALISATSSDLVSSLRYQPGTSPATYGVSSSVRNSPSKSVMPCSVSKATTTPRPLRRR